jgi:glycosyltransferase involved in cell wall biosynthesis
MGTVMRIGVFSDNFYPELSGIADSIVAVGRELAGRGHHIHIYAPRYTRPDHARLGLPPDEIELGRAVGVTRLPSLPYPTGTGQGRIVVPTGRCWRRLRRFRPDLVHVHLPFGVGLEGVRAARMLGTPLVGTNHTPLTEFLGYAPVRADRLRRLAARYTAWFYNRCDFVSSPARAIFDEMETFGFRAPHRVVSNPIRLDVFSPRPDKARLKRKFGFPEMTILYAGRLAAEKRLDLAIEAVAALAAAYPEICLALVGRGAQEDGLKALCASLGVEERVKFLGFLPDVRRLAEIYNASDVFVIPSTAETQSMAAMQAMACGLPVVGARAWGLTEYITEANGILVDPGDRDALARGVACLLRRPELRRRLGSGGRAFVRAFSASAVALEWEDLYGRVVESARRRRAGSLRAGSRAGALDPPGGEPDETQLCDSRVQRGRQYRPVSGDRFPGSAWDARGDRGRRRG